MAAVAATAVTASAADVHSSGIRRSRALSIEVRAMAVSGATMRACSSRPGRLPCCGKVVAGIGLALARRPSVNVHADTCHERDYDNI